LEIDNKGHETPSGSRKLALLVEYEGTRYKGFQLQINVPTIQGELEKALKSFTREDIRIRGASRTDAGAHAKGQVVDFVTDATHPVTTFVKALNWHLPEDIRIRGGCETTPSFNARKDAIARKYRYTILNSRWPSALLRRSAHWVRKSLDINKMQEAARYLVGTHDFSALIAKLPPDRSPIRTVNRWTVEAEYETIYIDSEASGFLPHQIRCTNGVLVNIGLGRAPIDTLESVLNGTLKELKNRPLLPAKGLTLVRVIYKDPLFMNEDTDETQ
jgi:tRNA pseudouridine38-40 synthase